MELDQIKAQINEILSKEKIKHVFHVDDRVSTFEQKKVAVIAGLKKIDIETDEGLVQILPEQKIDLTDDPEFIVAEVEKLLNTDNIGFVKNLLDYLKLNDVISEGDEDNDAYDIQQYFNKGQFTAIEPQGAVEAIASKIRKIGDDGKVLVLFDLDLKEAKGEFIKVTGVELLIKLKAVDGNDQCICSIFTHLVKSTDDEIIKRKQIIDEHSDKLNKSNLFVLAKKRKNDSLLFGDGIKKVILNPHYENIKDQSISLLKEAFVQSCDDFEAIDTYEFDHIILHSSNIEGVWAGETLLRVFNVIFDRNIKRDFIASKYPDQVNPFFEKAIKLARHSFPLEKSDIPSLNRDRIRNLELYVEGDILNPLFEPISNGDIFEVKSGDSNCYYILAAQECDVILRSNGKRNRKNDFFTLLKIDFKSKAQIQVEIEKFTSSFGFKNYYFSNKFALPNYYNDDHNNIGIVDFRNELMIYASILDLVSFNSDGYAKFNSTKDYPLNSFSQAVKNRFNSISKICEDKVEYLMQVQERLAEQGVTDIPSIIVKLVETVSPTNKSLGNPTPYENNGFDFGIRRVKRLKNNMSSKLLERYGYYLSRAAELPDYADEIELKDLKVN